jgi:hypothetical protein
LNKGVPLLAPELPAGFPSSGAARHLLPNEEKDWALDPIPRHPRKTDTTHPSANHAAAYMII